MALHPQTPSRGPGNPACINPKQIHLLQINVNGLRSKIEELRLYVEETSPDVILISETKLNNNPTPLIPNYLTAATRDRQNEHTGGGGVAIYIRNNIDFSNISPDIDDMAAIEIKLNNNQKIGILCFYRHPMAPLLDQYTYLEEISKNYRHLIIGGDLNAKHQFYGSKSTNRAGDSLFNLCEQLDLTVGNNPDEPTFISSLTNTKDIIDYWLMSAKISKRHYRSWTGDDVGSDHLPLHLSIDLQTQPLKHEKKAVRMWKNCRWDEYTQEIANTMNLHETAPLLSTTDIETECQVLTDILTTAIDNVCPKKTIRDQAFRLSTETVQKIRNKRKVRRKMQKDNNPALKEIFNHLKKQIAAAIKEEKRRAWENATKELNDTKGRDFWKKIQNINWPKQGTTK